MTIPVPPTRSPEPKETRPVLEKVINTFAVRIPDTGHFNYYKIKLEKEVRKEGSNFVDILISPPVLSEGYISFKRKIYLVTLRDLLRRRVNVSTPITNFKFEFPTTVPLVVDNTTTSIPDKLGIGNLPGGGDDESINLHWEEQIESLFYLDDTEEKWQIESITQPGPNLESIPVQDSNEAF